MEPRYNYKLWNPNLSQFVAQPNLLTAGEIHALGGVVIPFVGIKLIDITINLFHLV